MRTHISRKPSFDPLATEHHRGTGLPGAIPAPPHPTADLEARQASAPGQTPEPGHTTARRDRPESQDAGRCLHLYAIVDPADQFQGLGWRKPGRAGQGQLAPEQPPDGLSPSGKVLRRLPVDGVELERLVPPVLKQGVLRVPGKLAEFRELTIAKTQNGEARSMAGGEPVQPLDESTGRAGCVAIAIRRSQDEQMPCAAILLRQLVHGRCVHALPSLA